MPALTIRVCTRADANSLAALYQQSAAYLRSLGDEGTFNFSADTYLQDGFGEQPAFEGILAEMDDKAVGYLLYTFTYDTDRAMRILYVLDLLVDENARGQGVGRKLMAQAKAIAKARGAGELMWAVYKHNKQAEEFYKQLGSERLEDVFFMSLKAVESGE
jgi:ribosomal protein S18 acetylase RimI-like enzyme